MSTVHRGYERDTGPSGASVDRSLRGLFRAIRRRCHGRTLVLGRGGGDLAAYLGGHDRDALVAELHDGEIGDASLPAGEFETVVLIDALEHLPDRVGDEVLARAWRLVGTGGRIVVSVPNSDAISEPVHARSFTRRGVTRLLRPLGKVRLITEQPYKWLLMYVEKRQPSLNPLWRERYLVTARLCRGRVIELGCGEGHLTKIIADRDREVVGVDLSKARIQRARQQYPEIPFLESDIRDLRFGEEFDTVVLPEVLEHVPEEVGSEILRTAWGLLRPGGRLVVSVPNEDCIPHPNHVRVFDRRGLKRLLQPLGRTRIVTDQPYRWLMMYVTKPGASHRAETADAPV